MNIVQLQGTAMDMQHIINYNLLPFLTGSRKGHALRLFASVHPAKVYNEIQKLLVVEAFEVMLKSNKDLGDMLDVYELVPKNSQYL